MIRSFVFNNGQLIGEDLEIEALRLLVADKGLILWVDLSDPSEEETRQVLEGAFHFHPLAIEDCVTPSSLPKIEDFEDYLFLVMHAVDFSRTEKFSTTELDLFLGKELLVTFHRKPLKSVDAVIDKIQKGSGFVARSPDRLAHLVLDGLVDNYQPVMGELRAEMEEIEEEVLEIKDADLTPLMLEVRSEISHLRQIVRPQREVVARLARGDSKLIRAPLLPYFRDLRNNLNRIETEAAAYSDQLLISFDLYLSRSSFQTNDGIKALTALTALSLPSTVLGSWYGMNFENMPELVWRYGYLSVFIANVLLTVLIWRWCKAKGWI